MMTVERLRAEGAIVLDEAARVVRDVLGRKPSKSTLIRWIERGSHGVNLEAQRVGNIYYTTRMAVEGFLGARRPAIGGECATEMARLTTQASAPTCAAGQRQHAMERAKDQLKRCGLRFLLVC